MVDTECVCAPHWQVYSREFQEGFHTVHPQYKRKGCDDVPSLDISDTQKCWVLIKNANVVAPAPELEVALVSALDHIGVRTRLKDPIEYPVDALGDLSMVS